MGGRKVMGIVSHAHDLSLGKLKQENCELQVGKCAYLKGKSG